MTRGDWFVRAAGAFFLLIELEAAFFGTNGGRACSVGFSWSGALVGLAYAFVLGFIVTIALPLVLIIFATRDWPYPDVRDPDVRFWYCVCAIGLPILVVILVLIGVHPDPKCSWL